MELDSYDRNYSASNTLKLLCALYANSGFGTRGAADDDAAFSVRARFFGDGEGEAKSMMSVVLDSMRKAVSTFSFLTFARRTAFRNIYLMYAIMKQQVQQILFKHFYVNNPCLASRSPKSPTLRRIVGVLGIGSPASTRRKNSCDQAISAKKFGGRR